MAKGQHSVCCVTGLCCAWLERCPPLLLLSCLQQVCGCCSWVMLAALTAARLKATRWHLLGQLPDTATLILV